MAEDPSSPHGESQKNALDDLTVEVADLRRRVSLMEVVMRRMELSHAESATPPPYTPPHVPIPLASVAPELPEGMEISINYDRAEFIEASMREVYKALFIAIALVLVVIYLFLGSLRVTLIPAIVVPVSVVATFIVMSAMGYTINILTLLGLVLAIGLVVDDAIVVLENI